MPLWQRSPGGHVAGILVWLAVAGILNIADAAVAQEYRWRAVSSLEHGVPYRCGDIVFIWDIVITPSLDAQRSTGCGQRWV